ncbi:MAG TPA: NAD(P)/FAD-dependent oxidoreductase [Candidatus Latescibacteria bacterium]|nr:NAD(P)/FAD-dependent oxidoreductase [Candidatus Latescibacterota bacterium]HJP29153.1 NAD(P)/FAD-dependent oxidoreductase [Candidatus Latescibacterota bacterium]
MTAMSEDDYDGIILGSGHNSLVLQAYLCRAGLRVLSLECNDVAGGGLCTEQWPAGSGFRHNTHSFYHRGLTQQPWYTDLDLERHGARYIEPDLNVAMLLPDGAGVLEWWTDFERTADSFARLSQRDAETLRRWRQAFLPVVRDILVPEAQAPPVPSPERTQRLQQTPAGRLLLETSRMSPRDFVLREFEHPAVQAGLLFFNGLREVDLRATGFGHHIPALLAADGKAQMCVGGSARLAEALTASIREAGGAVRTGVTPACILVERGPDGQDRVTGVETTAGERIKARQFVVSGLNPQQTFIDLIDAAYLPGPWREAAAAFRYNLLAPLFGLYLNLDEAPRYTATEQHPELENAFMVLLGLESVEDFDEMVRSHEQGRIPPTVMWGSCPTQFDGTQAPVGGHTAFMWEKVPYRLGGSPGNWDAEAEIHGRRMLARWQEYAPNLQGTVRQSLIRPVHEIPALLPNMQDADLLVGSLGHGQVGYDRPFPGAGHYRGHLDGLYLCGSCCHPSGNVTGLPGYNAAQVLLSDLGL